MGLFLSGFLSDKVGRKRSLLVAGILQIVSAYSVYFCTSFPALLSAVALSNLFSCMVQVQSLKRRSIRKFVITARVS